MVSSGPESVVVRNHKFIYADVVILTKSNPSRRIDDHPIPDSVAILIKNNPANPPNFVILVDRKPVTATSYPLLPNDNVSYLVENANCIWVGFQGALPAGVTQIIVNYTFEADE